MTCSCDPVCELCHNYQNEAADPAWHMRPQHQRWLHCMLNDSRVPSCSWPKVTSPRLVMKWPWNGGGTCPPDTFVHGLMQAEGSLKEPAVKCKHAWLIPVGLIAVSLFELDAQRRAIILETPPQGSWPFGHALSVFVAHIISSNTKTTSLACNGSGKICKTKHEANHKNWFCSFY